MLMSSPKGTWEVAVWNNDQKLWMTKKCLKISQLHIEPTCHDILPQTVGVASCNKLYCCMGMCLQVVNCLIIPESQQGVLFNADPIFLPKFFILVPKSMPVLVPDATKIVQPDPWSLKKLLIPIPWLVIPDPGAVVPGPTLLIPDPTPLIPYPPYLVMTLLFTFLRAWDFKDAKMSWTH